MKFKKVNIDDFIKNHTYINYCEAILYPDGDITYAAPSHLNALIRITDRTADDIYDEMPIYDSPIHWLMEYTGCISVWTDGVMFPKDITDQQVESLKKLKNEKLTQVKFY